MGVEGAMGQPGGLHDFSDTSVVEAALAKQPRGLLPLGSSHVSWSVEVR
jgi:hypothetical protein